MCGDANKPNEITVNLLQTFLKQPTRGQDPREESKWIVRVSHHYLLMTRQLRSFPSFINL
jgi:hypothetical protein